MFHKALLKIFFFIVLICSTLVSVSSANEQKSNIQENPIKILFVCTGNTCRSPMAEVITKDAFEKAGIPAKISSAGTVGEVENPATQNAILTMEKRGLDLNNHHPRQITVEMVNEADLVLIMAQKNKDFVLNMPGVHSEKVFLLHEYVNGILKNIADPYGESLEIYESTAVEIEEAVQNLAFKLKGEANQP